VHHGDDVADAGARVQDDGLLLLHCHGDKEMAEMRTDQRVSIIAAAE
jgi:hypothetical protein